MAHSAPPVPLDADADPTAAIAPAPARERWSWAVYDFANTIFSMNVATLFFAVWLVADLGASNRAVAVGASVSSLLVALSIPVFGAISDARRRRKPWVVGFTLVTVLATAGIGVIGYTAAPLVGDNVVGADASTGAALGGGALAMLIVAFIVANYAYQGALPFYNAMMGELAPPREQGRLSGFGTALGYVGSIVGVIVGMCFFAGGIPGIVQLPAGALDTLRSVVPFTGAGGRVSTFVPTALLFLIFSLPLFFFCRDHAPAAGRVPIALGNAFRDVAATIRDARQRPGVLRFILASFLYQDAMGTIIAYMALYAVEAVGFEAGMETTLFVVLTIPAVLGSWVIGHVVDRIGPKRTLAFVITSWVVLLIGMILAPNRMAFWFVGAGIGLIFGGVATAERPLLLSLVPDAEAGRYFSLMVLSARAAAIVGPLVWALTVDGLTPSLGKGIAYRAAVGAVALAMVLALVLLRRVPDTSAARRAEAAA